MPLMDKIDRKARLKNFLQVVELGIGQYHLIVWLLNKEILLNTIKDKIDPLSKERIFY